MPTQSPELHQFPVPPELEGINLVELSHQAALNRFRGNVAISPLERSDVLSHGDNTVWVKRLDMVPGGHKFYSAGNSFAELREEGHADFVFATAGTYGIAAGHALALHGGRGTALVPKASNPEKQALMRELGLEVEEAGDNFNQTLELAWGYAEREGKIAVHPYASRANLIGTGIIGWELADSLPEITHAVFQYGGGSLAGGTGTVLKGLRPDVHVTVVQPGGCSPFVESVLDGGEPAVAEEPRPGYFSKFGGVGVGETHPMTLGLASQLVDAVVTTTPREVYATMHDVSESKAHGRVLPEFAAAVSLQGAYDLARSPDVSGAHIVAFLTGAHPDHYPPNYLANVARRRRQDEADRLVRFV